MENPMSQDVERQNLPSAGLIREERQWMEAPCGASGADAARIVASRWTGSAAPTSESLSEIDQGHHVVAIALRPMNAAFYVGRNVVADGRISQGTIGINKPGETVRAVFRGSYDVLHLYVPNALLASYLGRVDQSPAAMAELFADCRTLRDPAIERLAHGLIYAGDIGAGFGPAYVDGICMAMLVRLLDLRFAAARQCSRQTVSELVNWRLKRVTTYIEQHLDEPIGLADLAASAGLSRMHFAAQFRAATGMRPHDYLLWRRIDRAMVLLRDHRHPLCDVAFDVGFKSQSHFTTVFKRFVGSTPSDWRRRNADPGLENAVGPAGVTLNFRPSMSALIASAPRQRAA